jgi:hypothetical protein
MNDVEPGDQRLALPDLYIYVSHIFHIGCAVMGIVNIEDELHEQLRRASRASCRSINAQAAFWIRLGMLCELNPGLSFQELMARELRAAGVDTPPIAA